MAVSLFIGFWAFVYQGYREDTGSQPTDSWPLGVACFGLAGVMTIRAVRRALPGLRPGPLAVVVLVVALALVAVAAGAIDAGNP